MKKLFLLSLPALLGLTLVAEQPAADPFRDVAERYVRLVLAVGQHDSDYVDAYYGPPEWRKQAEAEKIALPDIATRGEALERDLGGAALPPAKEDAELLRLRTHYPERQLASLRTRVACFRASA
jgi:hypothetical protein